MVGLQDQDIPAHINPRERMSLSCFRGRCYSTEDNCA